MKIGIMGGTFDPIHNGHLMLGTFAYHKFHLDEIWFMPNGNPPHKSNDTIESVADHRVEMVKLAIKDCSYFKVELSEVNNHKVSYSYQTMEQLQAVYPEYEFYYIIGADSLFSLEKWKNPQRFLEICTVLAAKRDEKTTREMSQKIISLQKKYNARIELLEMPMIDIASHDIRRMIKEGKPIHELVPDAVEQYITEQKLFKDDEHESITS